MINIGDGIGIVSVITFAVATTNPSVVATTITSNVIISSSNAMAIVYNLFSS